jgi:hypothetical protein
LGAVFLNLGLDTYPALVAAFGAATFFSGVGVYLWLKGQCRAPLVGALLFMMTPYQLFNFYQRGAIAEFVATAMLPFVLLGIRQMREGRRGGTALTALGYAALIMSHLPLSLLASVFLFAPYLLMTAWKTPQMLARIAATLVVGIGIAGVYLIPALALEPYRSSADLWTLPYLQPATWSVWNASAWADQTYRAVVLVSAALAVPAIGLIVRNPSRWAILALLSLVIAVGAIPVVWSLPLLRSVQFPFRLLPVAELFFVTAAALAPKERVPWLMVWASFLLMGGFIIAAKPESANFGDRVMREIHPDVPENLPPGHRPYSWPSKWALDVAARHRRPEFHGKVTIEPVFYYPAFKVECQGRSVRTFADPGTQLLAHEGRGCSRSLGSTKQERVGAWISMIALSILVSLLVSPWLLEQRRLRRRENRPRNT